MLAAGLLGALLLFVAEFTTLFQIKVQGSTSPLRSVSTGSHHGYAIALIAACAASLTIIAWRAASRPALIGIGLLGVAALLIAVLRDLPDATGTGLVRVSGQYANAAATASAGLYMETLGAVVLLITAVSGFLLVVAPASSRHSDN